METTYEVWAYKAPYSDEPDGWSVQYFTEEDDAWKWASERVAEEVHVDVMVDVRWSNDHIVQEKVRSYQIA